MLQIQPLTIKDFSGGITENVLGGDPRRYQKADNYLITVDKMLLERAAFIPIDSTNYILPSGNAKVNGMFSFINESILFAQSARSLFTIDPYTSAWLSVKGPSGNEPIQSGDDTAQTTFGEYGHQVYFASDGGVSGSGVQPSKIYRNTSNAWVANTAGLPKSFSPASFTKPGLLANCILLANSLRASFVSHLLDAVNAAFTAPTAVNNTGASYPSNASNLHLNVDNYSLSYFQTVSFVGLPDQPSPIPTPATNAVDETSLYSLVLALNLSYEHHRQDALAGVNGNTVTAGGVAGTVTPQYHYCTSIWSYNHPTSGLFYTRAPAGPHIPLNSLDKPTTLLLAATQLNDLLQKWNWHRKGVWTHSPANDPIQFDRYAPIVPKIAPVFLSPTYPTITADFSDIYNYANSLKKLFNYHINNANSSPSVPYISGGANSFHTMIDTGLYGYKQQITLADVSSEDDFALMTYWLRTMYQMHYTDASVNTGLSGIGSFNAIVTTSAGSPTLTAITYTDGVTGVTPFVGSFTGPISATGSVPSGGQKVQAVLSVVAPHQVNIDDTMPGNGTQTTFFSASMYHVNLPALTVPVSGQVTRNLEQVSDILATTSFSTSNGSAGWLILLNDFFNGFLNHSEYANVHYSGYFFGITYQQAPGLNAQIITVPFFVPTLSTLAYAFLYSHTYTVEPNGIQYEVFSNPVFSDSLSLAKSLPINYTVPVDAAQAQAQETNQTLPYPQAIIKNSYGNLITNLPSITNDSSTNYDTANIKLEIYRTQDGGNTFYQIASLANGTSSYLDITNDTLQNGNLPALTSNQLIYTSGGVVGYDQPAQSKFIHAFNNTFYYGAITDTGQFFPNRIIQSNQNTPDHAPATFFDDLPDSLVGLSSTKSNLIAICSNSIFRMSGGFNPVGQGTLTHDKISDVIGGINTKSIVQTEVGVFFAGKDGFYYTDGYQCFKISLDLNLTYKGLTSSENQRQSIQGCYDKTFRRVWWAMKSSPTSHANDIEYVFYLDFGVKPSGVFTTSSNALNLQPMSQVFQNGVMYYGHSNGYVLKSDEDSKSDALIDITKTASQWQTTPIPYDWLSCALDVGTTFKRKYITKVHLVGENTGNALVQPYVIRDMNADGKGIYDLIPVNYRGNIAWGDPTFVWADPLCVWNPPGKMDVWRRMPGRAMRSDFVQFGLKPANSIIYSTSQNYPEFSFSVVNSTLKTATIQTPAGFTAIIWPLDVVGYYISFANDLYTNQFLVTAVAGAVITFADSGNLSVNQTSEWQIAGIKKNQRTKISSLDIHYAYMGDQTQQYSGALTSDGAGNSGGNP